MTESERKARMERALEYGGPTHTLADVARDIEAGRAQWWSRDDGMIVTLVDEFPLFKAVRYWLVAGSLADCRTLEPEIDEWALDQGCTIGTGTGRKGWERAIASTGWRLHSHTFWKPLGGVSHERP